MTIQELINRLRHAFSPNAITPEALGYILQAIYNLIIAKDNLIGDKVPTSTDGVDGNFYFDKSAKILYIKANGAWIPIISSGSEGTPIVIAQEEGNSLDIVMSQNAVSTLLETIRQSIIDKVSTESLNDILADYYLKTSTYSKEEVNGLINAINGFTPKIVLSVSEVVDTKYIYFIPTSGVEERDNKYDEYLFINGEAEKIGTFSAKVDLSQYVPIAMLNTALSDIENTYVAKDEEKRLITREEADKLTFAVARGDLEPYSLKDTGVLEEIAEIPIEEEKYIKFFDEVASVEKKISTPNFILDISNRIYPNADVVASASYVGGELSGMTDCSDVPGGNVVISLQYSYVAREAFPGAVDIVRVIRNGLDLVEGEDFLIEEGKEDTRGKITLIDYNLNTTDDIILVKYKTSIGVYGSVFQEAIDDANTATQRAENAAIDAENITNLKIDEATITQYLGGDETKVMSQKAVTDELDTKANHGYESNPKTLKEVEDNAKNKVDNLEVNVADDKLKVTSVAKTYQTEAEALADKNPIDPTTSLPLTVGQFISIVDDGEKNGIYRISSISGDGTMSLELQGKLGDLSEYAKKSEVDNITISKDGAVKKDGFEINALKIKKTTHRLFEDIRFAGFVDAFYGHISTIDRTMRPIQLTKSTGVIIVSLGGEVYRETYEGEKIGVRIHKVPATISEGRFFWAVINWDIVGHVYDMSVPEEIVLKSPYSEELRVWWDMITTSSYIVKEVTEYENEMPKKFICTWGDGVEGIVELSNFDYNVLEFKNKQVTYEDWVIVFGTVVYDSLGYVESTGRNFFNK